MSTKAIREYIANQIRSIDNIGNVFEKNILPNPKKKESWTTLFEYDGRMQSWMVSRSSLGPNNQKAQGFLANTEKYKIVTFLGYNDAIDSETLFDESLDSVYELFASDRQKTLGTTVDNVNSVIVPESALTEINSLPCHYAEIIIEVTRFK